MLGVFQEFVGSERVESFTGAILRIASTLATAACETILKQGNYMKSKSTPVQAVLDRPMRPYRTAELDHVARQATDEVASFPGYVR